MPKKSNNAKEGQLVPSCKVPMYRLLRKCNTYMISCLPFVTVRLQIPQTCTMIDEAVCLSRICDVSMCGQHLISLSAQGLISTPAL